MTPAAIDESGSNNVSTVTVNLNRAGSVATPVSPATASDYNLSTNTTLTIAAGSTTSTGAVTLTAADNTVRMADEMVECPGRRAIA